MNILIRADSSSRIGTGHIMRDLVLVKQFQSDNIIFACQKLEGNINSKIEKEKYPLKILKSNNIDELVSLIKELKIDMLIIDHYEIDQKYEKELKEKTGVKLFVFDDTYEKHYCDILLNHNISANKKKYINLVPKNCELRCGSKYTLLREEFFKIKKYKNTKELSNRKKVFVSMGGSDYNNISMKILEVIKKFKSLDVDLVTTFANKNLKKLEKFSQRNRFVTLHIDTDKIAKLIQNSDFAIITPSVVANEVYLLRKQIISIKTAKNQLDMYKYLKKKYYYVINKFNENKLRIVINKQLMKRRR